MEGDVGHADCAHAFRGRIFAIFVTPWLAHVSGLGPPQRRGPDLHHGVGFERLAPESKPLGQPRVRPCPTGGEVTMSGLFWILIYTALRLVLSATLIHNMVNWRASFNTPELLGMGLMAVSVLMTIVL
jgi:hypothetical protein